MPALVFLVVGLVVALLGESHIADSDIWFHFRNAQLLAQTHAFPHADVYTFTSAGAPLVNHEWLSELPLYFAFVAGGQRGLMALYLLVIWLAFGGVYLIALRRGANCIEAGIVTVACVALGSYSFGPRVQHFGWLCFVALMIILDRFERTGKGLWTMPLVFAVWVNLHGSWILGFVVLGIHIAGGLIEGEWGRIGAKRWTRAELEKLGVASAASIAALFANPYGYRLAVYPIDVLFRQQTNLDNVIEWQAVDFHTGYGKLALGMLAVLLAFALFSRTVWKVRDVVLVGFVVWASLTHVRFLILAGLVLVPILAPELHLLTPHDPKTDRRAMNAVIAVALAAVVVVTFPRATNVESQFPGEALRFMADKKLEGHLFHFYDYGGYIEWNAPSIKTFADGRTDLFAHNGVLDDYIKINTLAGSLELLDKYEIDTVLFPRDKKLDYLLDHSPAWTEVYSDPLVKLWRRTPREARPPPKYTSASQSAPGANSHLDANAHRAPD